jgi:hypothetical protein
MQTFTASDQTGQVYRLEVHQEYSSAATRADPSAVVPGQKRILTEYGESVTRIEKGKYEIVQTGVIVRSSDPAAP